MQRTSSLVPSDLTIRRVDGEARRRTMAFIRKQFSNHFGASVEDDTDEVYAVEGSDGEIQAAFGLNRTPESFFCRHYVGCIHSTLANIEGNADQSRRILEMAHLCVRRPATLCRLMGHLAAFLRSKADYLICTVTWELSRFFQRKGLIHQCLANAYLGQLPEGKQSGWGVYYQHEPQVVLGNLANACIRLGVTSATAEI